ncbi:kinase-like domain-containing protein [Pyronema domesticum]|nr:kinase-like domain-containing protein [Pyronema domesticum]
MADVDKAKLVREHAEKTCKAEMEAVPDDVPYTVVDLVGKGSFGSVFKGIHNETKQVFAIKSLDLEQTDEDIGDIQKEINLLSQLTKGDAPNITAFHGSYVLGHKLWIIMDFCSGGSMRTLMKAGPIEEKYIAIVIRETLMALVYLHAQGIIHRDIKAANILVNADGRVQLCDFGVSAQLANKANKRNTFVGTPQWMAPEALTGGMYDFKIDIWSFGITIIELAKQNPPLYQYHPDRVIDMIPRIPPPRLEGGNWSDALRQFVALCLNEIPDQRPTAEELMKTKYVKSIKTPTSAMRDLCLRHADWERGGGARVSMMMMYPNGRYDDGGNDPADPEWDFDTVKSRVSGVPKEFEMLSSIQRQASYGSGGTLRGYPPRPTQLGGRGRPKGAEKLFRLFKDPNEADEDEDMTNQGGLGPGIGPAGPGSRSTSQSRPIPAPIHPPPLGMISIPSFDDDGNILLDSPVTARPIPRPDFPRSVSPSHGMISMPTEEEMMAMALAKATARPASPNPGVAGVAGVGASIPRSLTPGPLTAIPPSTPVPAGGLENPTITRTRAGNITGSPDSFTSPASARSVSPNRPAVASSAPSSPPRTGLLGMNKPHHLSSKSVPTFAGSAGREREEPPPIPGIVRSADSAVSNGPGQNPHQKARSQDIGRSRTGKMARPSHLNLASAGSGAFIESTRLGSPRGLPGAGMAHAQAHGVALNGNGVGSNGNGVAGSMSAMSHMSRNNGVKQILAEFSFPQLAPLDTAMLAATSGEELAREMERIMAGLGDALEVMEVGLRMLSQERQGRGEGEEEEEE